MRRAMWTYPWDVLDCGVPVVESDLRERAGLNAISIAASYHAGRFFQPRSPRRKAYFPEDGTIYFRPDPARWEGLPIRPLVAGLIEREGDVLAELAARRESGGLALHCWTVCLHNTRLGMAHPHACTRNAFGDPNYYSLCPSNAEVRRYATTLVADLTHRYRPDVVELETPGFMPFAHGYHHEKDGVGLLAEDDFLLSLCFCPACIASAAAAGIDAEAARRRARSWIADGAERAVPAARWPDFATRGPAVFDAWPEIAAFIAWRFRPVTTLVADIRAAAHAASKVHVIDVHGGWQTGSDLAALGRACDGIMLCVYGKGPEDIAADLALARAAIGPDRHLGAGLRVFYPEVPGPDTLRAQTQAARAAGADGINYYNYGLIPSARLDWVGGACRAIAG